MTRRKNKPTENGEVRNKVGQFTGAMPGPGRKRGVPNKTTSVLKEAILIAAANSGDCIAQQMLEKALEDGNAIEANGGLVGYLEHIALNFPQQFIPLLGKVLPLVVNGSVDHNHNAYKDGAERFTNANTSIFARTEADRQQ